MWQNGAPTPPAQPAAKRRTTAMYRGDEEALWWGQFLLSLILVGGAYAAMALQWPFLPQLRSSFRQAMRLEQSSFLSDTRILSKFTEQVAETFNSVTDVVGQHLDTIATAETAIRTVHGKESPVPSGARAEGYCPSFSLTFPLVGMPVTETSGYGWRTNPMGGSGSEFHLGNDLAAAQGTDVVAAADGVVRYAGVHSSYGNYLRILHENGDETLYAHLQYLFVHTGQIVFAGECLGTVGRTGNATGPHLHFELLHKGIRYDPTEALQIAS